MPKFDEDQLNVAQVYSQSMIGLARDGDQLDSLLDELLELDKLIDENKALSRFLFSPTVDADQRRDFIEKTLRGRASDLLVDSLQVLNRKDRTTLLPAVIETYRLRHEELTNRIDVRITTAVPLTEELRTRIAEETSRLAGKQAELVESVDASIIGGMVIHIGDTRLDTSVARELGKLTTNLRARASAEIHSGRGMAIEA